MLQPLSALLETTNLQLFTAAPHGPPRATLNRQTGSSTRTRKPGARDFPRETIARTSPPGSTSRVEVALALDAHQEITTFVDRPTPLDGL